MILIVGAGLAGLSTARFLKQDHLLIERESSPGGLARTVNAGPFSFDYAGHWFHARRAWVKRLLPQLLGRDWVFHRRDARIYSHGVFTPYPFQLNLAGLPVPVIVECLMGLSRASQSAGPPPRDFEQFILQSMGPGVARHFMVPYNRKLWNIHPRNMTTDWMGRFVPRPDLKRALLNLLDPGRPDPAGYNAGFHYPRHSGIVAVPRALADSLPAIEFDVTLQGLDAKRRRATLSDRRVVPYDHLVSTMPLPELVHRTTDAPASVRRAASQLRWSSVLVLQLGISDVRLPVHWFYLPETPPAFYRAGVYSNVSPALAPQGAGSFYIEYSYPQRIPRPARDVSERRVLSWLKSAGVVGGRARVLAALRTPIPCAYVTYDRRRNGAVKHIQSYYQRHGVHSIGRYGAWEYSSMEDAMDQGRQTAHLLNIGRCFLADRRDS